MNDSRSAATAFSVALVAMLALGASAQVWAVVCVVVLLQGVVACAPSIVVDGDAIEVSPLPGLVSGAVATALTLNPQLIGRASSDQQWAAQSPAASGTLMGVIPAIAIALIVATLCQFARRPPRTGLFAVLAWSTCVAMFAAFATGWIGSASANPALVFAGAAGVAVGLVVWGLPLPPAAAPLLAVLAGSAAGAAAAIGESLLAGAILGAAAAMCAILGQVVARGVGAGRFDAPMFWAFPGAISVAFAAPVVYVGVELVTSLA